MELDDTLAEVHVSLANLRFIYEWDWSGAETAFQRAIQLKPNSAAARFFYSDFLISMRRLEEAMAEMGRALEWLEKAYERRETPLVHLSVGWDWDPLRDDPRFQELLLRMNLEP
jgi:Tfp pilus assembly protein PilF